MPNVLMLLYACADPVRNGIVRNGIVYKTAQYFISVLPEKDPRVIRGCIEDDDRHFIIKAFLLKVLSSVKSILISEPFVLLVKTLTADSGLYCDLHLQY